MMNLLGSSQNLVTHLEIFLRIIKMIKQGYPILSLLERELFFNFLVKKLGNQRLVILECLPPLLYIL